MKLRLITLALSLLLGVFVSATVFALSDDPSEQTTTQQSQTSDPEHTPNSPTQDQTDVNLTINKLTDEKLRTCLARSANITDTLQRLVKNSSIQLETIDELSDRTKRFYTGNGQMLTDYEQLTSDASAKRAGALANLEPLRTIAMRFNCNNEDPKGDLSTFKTSLQTYLDSLASYQASIRTLITNVKAAQSPEATQ